MSDKVLYIGIDPGVNTGVALWNASTEEFESISGNHIIDAMDIVSANYHRIIEVVLEDARLWKYGTDPNRAQGAGSIKRDCSVWESYFKHYNIPYQLKKPNKNITKYPAAYFKVLTKFKAKTNEHGRDAAMLVFKRQL